MKANSLSFLIIILTSCKTSDKPKEIDYTGFVEKQVIISAYDLELHKLDSFAELSIKIPDRLDTFYQFQHYPDIVRGNFRKYRFADSKYSILNERDGLEYYLRSADSLYQLTISHLTLIPADKDSMLAQLNPQDTVLLTDEVRNIEYRNDSLQFILKKFLKGNAHPIIIAVYQIPSFYRKNKMKLSILGIMRIKKRQIAIRAECDADDTTGFIDNMYKSFLSIRIKENP